MFKSKKSSVSESAIDLRDEYERVFEVHLKTLPPMPRTRRKAKLKRAGRCWNRQVLRPTLSYEQHVGQ